MGRDEILKWYISIILLNNWELVLHDIGRWLQCVYTIGLGMFVSLTSLYYSYYIMRTSWCGCWNLLCNSSNRIRDGKSYIIQLHHLCYDLLCAGNLHRGKVLNFHASISQCLKYKSELKMMMENYFVSFHNEGRPATLFPYFLFPRVILLIVWNYFMLSQTILLIMWCVSTL